ncbi:MAG: mechanosensitive ion channel protein MscS [Alteromonadaceae bacterium]|nr:mechanosensitive ion channel protein MscS [Alteromonadaceae bacterium]
MKWKLIWPVLATLLIPLVVAYFYYPDTHLPPGFGEFPPQKVADAPGFSWIYFLLMLPGVFFVTALVIWPKKFGFKGAEPAPRPSKLAPFPWWFWAGLVCNLFFWGLMWDHSMMLGNLVYWSFTPMWWGFIFVLDGIVYKRNNGVSLASSKPKVFWISAIISVVGWAYFEYYDYFVLANWYYPNAHAAPWSNWILDVEFLLTYSTVTPVIFEWYTLFMTIPGFYERYQNGPKWVLNGNKLILIGAVLIGLMVVLPYPLFWVVWIGPFAVMTGLLLKLGIWNPFTDIAKGNWGAGVLIALASMANGLFWEFWNHGSFATDPASTTNPNFWIYNIPYVNVIHLFSEMPLLGYFGYLPFGVLVWQVFIWSGNVFGFNSDISLQPNLEDNK